MLRLWVNWRTSFVAFVICLMMVFALFIWNTTRLSAVLGSPATDDFKRFWAAAGVFASGQNPYDLSLVSKYSILNDAGAVNGLPLYYPILMFTVLLPITIFSFNTARVIYLTFLGSIFFLLWVLPSFVSSIKNLNTFKFGAAPFAILCSYILFLPMILMWWVGAITIIPYVAIVFFFILYGKKKILGCRFGTGMCLALTLTKPTTCILMLAFVLTSWCRRRLGVEILGFVTALISLLIITSFFVDSRESIGAIEDLKQVFAWNTPVPTRYLMDLLGFDYLGRFFPICCGMAFAIYSGIQQRQKDDLIELISLVFLPLGFILTPFAWTYDFSSLLFTISYVFHGYPIPPYANKESISHSYPIYIILLLNIILWCSPLSMESHWWYPISILLVALIEARAIRRDGPSQFHSPKSF